MPILCTQDSLRLEIVHSVYKNTVTYEQLPDGELYPTKKEILVKQMRVKKWFKKEAITSVEEYITARNTVAKSRCIVYDKYSCKFYATFHKLDDVIKSIEPHSHKNQIGFTNDTKIYRGGSQIHKLKKRR
jgi:hypothetical protein